MKMVTFKVNQEQYALPVEIVSSIERLPMLRPIPMAPTNVLGLINLRGVVMTVVDMRKILHMQEREMTDETRLLVINDLAYLVDAAEDVLDIVEDQLGMTEGEDTLIQGVWNHEDQLIMVLRPDKLRELVTQDSVQRV